MSPWDFCKDLGGHICGDTSGTKLLPLLSSSSRPHVPSQPDSFNPLWCSSSFRCSRSPFQVYSNLLKSWERQKDATWYQYQPLKSEDYSIMVPKLCTKALWGATVNHCSAIWCFKETKWHSMSVGHCTSYSLKVIHCFNSRLRYIPFNDVFVNRVFVVAEIKKQVPSENQRGAGNEGGSV